LDKYEYKLRLEEIRELNKKGRFQEAAQVADTVDWNKVRNVSTLCVISDVYKINRRFEDAKAMLLMANDKNPQNRRISYALCDLTIKMGQVVEAVEYYKEFVQQAPNDNNRYILLYKIYEAQDISLEERIAVLKEYKKREYDEKWAYELAFLFHRVGLATECIEECDQLILWFGEGKYVIKAMELKQLYTALSPAQQQAYDRMTGKVTEPEVTKEKEEPAAEEEKEQPMQEAEQTLAKDTVAAGTAELDIQVKPMDMGEYNTINLQAALAESMREVLEPAEKQEMEAQAEEIRRAQILEQHTIVHKPDTAVRRGHEQKAAEDPAAEYGGENAEYLEDVTRVIAGSEDLTNGVTGQLEEEETERVLRQVEAGAVHVKEEVSEKMPVQAVLDKAQEVQKTPEGLQDAETAQAAEQKMSDAQTESSMESPMDNLLAQEYDGQISLALPEERVTEKQITGQMNIEDVLREWERMKSENARKRKEETREWMLQQTGSLFAEFDQQAKDGVLEQLERAAQLAGQTEAFDDSDEIEELEEIEENAEQQPVWTQPSAVSEAPTPVNAAARAVMAENGVSYTSAAASSPEALEESTAEAAAGQNTEIQKQAEEKAADQKQAQETVTEETSEEQDAESEPQAPAENEQETAAAEEKASAAEGKNLEDTAALHARIKEEQIQEHMRHMSREEKERFAPFVPTRGAMRQLVAALDAVSLSAFTGNVILTGAPGADTVTLAKNMIRSIRSANNNFSGKVAKVTGDMLNEKSPAEIISKIPCGALIVEKANKLSAEGAAGLADALNQEHTGVIVFLLETKKGIERLVDRCPQLAESFTARYDIAALDSGTLVKYGCQYAYNQEFAIDELGRLALHTRIEDMQTSEHAVTVDEVRDLIDEAIAHATRFSLHHFWDIIVHRRYDSDDMIILRERDFI